MELWGIEPPSPTGTTYREVAMKIATERALSEGMDEDRSIDQVTVDVPGLLRHSEMAQAIKFCGRFA